ncbi:MAG: hypothetical protein HY763_13580 [Planctomycetes bacterium]|nr:hypothetical protein [Planctomycetota bacterium]
MDRGMRGTRAALAALMLAGAGCGVGTPTDFPHRLIGAGGQLFTLEELEEIANDGRIDDDAKREAFRNLGIEDEELIEALLEL